MSESLADLSDLGGTEWRGRVWFTPKHAVEVAYNQLEQRGEEMSPPGQQAENARQLYETMRRDEWEFRLTVASQLVADDGHWGAEARPEPEELARRMLLLDVTLFGDGSGFLAYSGPPPFEEDIIEVSIERDGAVDSVEVYS